MSHLQTMFRKAVVIVTPSETIEQAAEAMERHHVGAIVVTEQQRPVGIITDRDIAMALALRGATGATPVQDVMTCPVATVSQDKGIFDVTRLMMEHALRRAPVVDDRGRLVGLVALDDLLVLLSREFDNLAKGVQAEVAAV
jgi:CBS domain-containing protein